MPQGHLSRARLERLLGRRISDSEIEAWLFPTKAEVERIEGDDLTVSVTPDRLDLLSEGGLAMALAGALGAAQGAVPWPPALSPVPFEIHIDRSVAPLRPVLEAVRVFAPADATLDADLLAEVIRVQEILHATVGRNRRAASLGVYPLAALHPPLRYALEPIDVVDFTPLGETTPRPARKFWESDPMALSYGALGRIDDRILTLRDSTHGVLSLPPVLNSGRLGEARAGDTALLLEATGVRSRTVKEILGLLQVVFASRGWSWAPTQRIAGPPIDGEISSPADMRSVELSDRLLHERSGLSLSPEEVVTFLRRARLSARRGHQVYSVEVPPWRPDIQGEVDLVEEVLFARGLVPEEGEVLPSRRRGQRLPEIRFRRRWAPLLLGLGAVPLYRPVLVSAGAVEELGGTGAIRIENPVSREYAYARPSLLVSLATTLRHNTRHGYPQRWSEIGPILAAAGGSLLPGTTRYHAAVLWAEEGRGFSDAAAAVDCLLSAFDVSSVREPLEHSAAIAGRSARVRVAGVDVAEMGEVHPRLLDVWGVPVPVAWCEIDLSALWPLVRPS